MPSEQGMLPSSLLWPRASFYRLSCFEWLKALGDIAFTNYIQGKRKANYNFSPSLRVANSILRRFAPRCNTNIPPDKQVRVDFEHLKCPGCGQTFMPEKK